MKRRSFPSSQKKACRSVFGKLFTATVHFFYPSRRYDAKNERMNKFVDESQLENNISDFLSQTSDALDASK